MRFYVVLTLALLFLCSFCLHAQDELDDRLVDSDRWFFGVALGYGQLENPLVKEKDIPLYILPDIRYYGERFAIENLDLSYALVEKKGFVLELIGSQNLDGLFFPGDHRDGYAAVAGIHPAKPWDLFDEPISEPEPVAPPHRSMSYMAGFELRYYSWIDAFISLQTDVSNVHHGEQLKVALQKNFQLAKLKVAVEANAQYKSKQLTRYYYNIDERDIANIDLYYIAEPAMNYQLQFNFAYPIAERWFAVASLRKLWIDSSLRQSPVIEQGQTVSYFIGVKYVI